MNTIDNYDFRGKRAIIRVDFNVPLDEQGNVTDMTRIRAAVPTIRKVLEGGGSVILMSHLGRPKKNNDMKYSLRQIVPAVEQALGCKVLFAGDCMGEEAARMARELKPGEVMMLENLRFYAEEEGKPRGLAEDASEEEKSAAKKAVKASPAGRCAGLDRPSLASGNKYSRATDEEASGGGSVKGIWRLVATRQRESDAGRKLVTETPAHGK